MTTDEATTREPAAHHDDAVEAGAGAAGPPAEDGAFARWLAERAGRLLLRVRAERGHDDPAALKAAGDKVSHDLLRAELARWRPADAVLSEEDADSRQAWEGGSGGTPRLGADRVWIVDPLDGTREYSEAGRADWAVHVALWSRTSSTGSASQLTATGLAAGAVALPAQGRTLATDQPPATPPPPRGRRPRLLASRSRPPAFLAALAADLDAELVPMGSAGAKIAAVISGEADAYVHAGGQYEWDSAAPVAVALAAGLYASRVDGSGLAYNQANPRLPDVLVCQPELAEPILTALRRHLPD